MPLRVVSAILFSPRGGSAHVARALAAGLRAHGCEVTLVAGSRGEDEPDGDARAFYGDVRAVSFAPALASPAPLRFSGPPGTAPIHPSFEDRLGAPDVVFAKLDDLDYEHQVRAWAGELERAGAREADVLHLHHLTPLNEAAAWVAPHVPVVGQVHGTELLMLEAIAAGPPSGWDHAERWAARLRRWAHRCARLVVVPAGVGRAQRLLGIPGERLLPLPGGVDTSLFARRELDRGRFWRTALSERPRGWLPGCAPGSVSYTAEETERLARSVVLLYVGRFTAVKRLDLLIEAFGRARRGARAPAGLVLVGGHPGEWEGEHPAQTVARLGVPDVFLAGWHTHDELPDILSAADALAIASDREQFGQVLLEAMACELPVVATSSPGPASIVEPGRTGWLVAPGDVDGLTAALHEAIENPEERARRGRLGRQMVSERFGWPSIAGRLAEALREVAGDRVAAAHFCS